MKRGFLRKLSKGEISMFNERMAVEKRMDQIFRRISMMQDEYSKLLDRLRELDAIENDREIIYPVRIVSNGEYKEKISKQINPKEEEPSNKCKYEDCLPEVVRILSESPIPVRASVLRERLETIGFTHKNFTSFMNELIKKDDRIVRSSRGFYEFHADEK